MARRTDTSPESVRAWIATLKVFEAIEPGVSSTVLIREHAEQ